nr:hypothetical protein [Tanacetum cinerariifolium]
VLPPWPAGSLTGKPVFYAHGDASDKIVDQHFFDEATAFLTGPSGSNATIRRYSAEHAITAAMLHDCRLWFQDQSSGL